MVPIRDRTVTNRMLAYRERIRNDPIIREALNARRRNNYRIENPPLPWYHHLSAQFFPYQQLRWHRQFGHCGTALLEGDSSFCCANGKKLVQPYTALPLQLIEIFNIHQHSISQRSRELNNLLRVPVVGVENPGHWVTNVGGSSTVVLQGRIYHMNLPSQAEGHFIDWMLYDQQAQ
jgi:hypothetical protein